MARNGVVPLGEPATKRSKKEKEVHSSSALLLSSESKQSRPKQPSMLT
jgi:hypothetical protein